VLLQASSVRSKVDLQKEKETAFAEDFHTFKCKNSNREGSESVLGRTGKNTEKEIFSAKVQVRRLGEVRYGKGTLTITDSNLCLNYKKFLGKRQVVTVPREQIAKTEFKNVEGPFEVIGIAPQKKWNWVTFVITLKDGTGFEFYIGELSLMKPKHREKTIVTYEKIQKLLES